jgi:HD domain
MYYVAYGSILHALVPRIKLKIYGYGFSCMKLSAHIIGQLAQTVEQFLAPLSGSRWLHVQKVAEKARQISHIFDENDASYLVAAAYLHDIGYAPTLYKTGFHPIDGAYYIQSLGHPRLASLVAHHSEARFEARLRKLEPLLSAFPYEYSPIADALTYCDLTTSPTGNTVTLPTRVAEIFGRYGETHIVSQALHQSLPYLSLAVDRTQSLLQASEKKNSN